MSFDPAQVAALARDRAGAAARHGRGAPLSASRMGPAAGGEQARHGLFQAVLRTRPQFLAYSVRDLPAAIPLVARNLFGLPLLTWTVRSPRGPRDGCALGRPDDLRRISAIKLRELRKVEPVSVRNAIANAIAQGPWPRSNSRCGSQARSAMSPPKPGMPAPIRQTGSTSRRPTPSPPARMAGVARGNCPQQSPNYLHQLRNTIHSYHTIFCARSRSPGRSARGPAGSPCTCSPRTKADG